MADINQQTEELARIMEQVNREMAAYGQISKSTGDQKRDAEIQAATGMKNFTKGAAAGADAVGHLASAGMAAGKAMLEGKKGATAFNDSLDGLSKAATAAGIALTLLVPGGVIVKGLVAGLTAVTAATIGMVKASNEMAEKLYKGYSGLAKSGAAAADGMTGVFNDAKKLGLSMNELDQFVGLVGENAGDLALFSGSVFEGRKQFADMGKAMEPYRKQLLAAGFNQEEINQGAMSYLKMQTRLGQTQNGQIRTGDQLAQGAKKYIDELDALTKLTGANRKEQEDMRQAALTEQMFAAQIRELVLKGDKKSLEAAEQLQQANIMATKISKEFGQSFRASVTGNLLDPAAQKLNMAAQGAQFEQIERLKDNTQNAAGAITEIGRAIGATADGFALNLAKLNVSDEFMMSYGEMQKVRIATEKDLVEALKKIDADRAKQAKGEDAITKKYAENYLKMQQQNEKFERTIFAGIENAMEITDRLANATDVLATGFEKLGKAVNKLLNIVGLGVSDTKVEAKEKEVGEAKSSHIAAMEAQKLATTPEQKAAADREVKFYNDKVKLLEQEKETLAKQDKNAQLDKEILKRSSDELKLKQAAYDKAMETASVKQKLGFGLDKDQQKAKKEIWEAYAKDRALSRNEGGARDKARAEAAAAQPAPPTAGGGRGSVAPTLPGPSPSAVPTSVEQLKEAGLTVKQGDVQQEGAVINPKTIELAKAIQGSLKGFGYFSGFNDKFHTENSPSSEHTKGNALDFVMKKAPTPAEGKEITSLLKSMGAGAVRDEYNNPSSKSTAGHIHAAVPGYADGGIAETPQLAFVAEKGPEAMIPLVNGAIPISVSLKDALNTPKFAGANEYGGINQGLMSTDLSAVKSIAEAAGAFDKLFGNVSNNLKTQDRMPDFDKLFSKITDDPDTHTRMPDFDKLFSKITDDPDTHTRMPDFGSMINSLSSTMFAAVESLKPEFIDSRFDRDMRQEVVEPEEATNDTATEVFDTSMSNEPTGFMEFIKEAKEANFAMLAMMSELVREQRNANDISTRILQVSSN